jgi:hypothetical protein
VFDVDAGRLEALVTFDHGERHALAFDKRQGFVVSPAERQGGAMDKNILAAVIRCDEAVARLYLYL